MKYFQVATLKMIFGHISSSLPLSVLAPTSDLDSTNISDRSSPPIRIVVYCDDTLVYGSALSDVHYCASMDLSVHSI